MGRKTERGRVQGLTADQWQSQEENPGLLSPGPVPKTLDNAAFQLLSFCQNGSQISPEEAFCQNHQYQGVSVATTTVMPSSSTGTAQIVHPTGIARAAGSP